MVDPEYLKDLEDSSLEPPKPSWPLVIAKWFLAVILFIEASTFAYFIVNSYSVADNDLDIWHYQRFAQFRRGQCITAFIVLGILILSLLLKITFLYGVIAEHLWLVIMFAIVKITQTIFAWTRGIMSGTGENIACAFYETSLMLIAITLWILLAQHLKRIRRHRHDQFVYLFFTENN